MLNLLFIAHNFHKKTKSNLFFVELLKKHFNVTDVYLGPDRYALDAPIFDVKPDLVVLWQLDYLAPIFINKGIKTLVAPMYDGSANLDESHWKLSSGASFLSFSFNLHRKIIEAGCKSFLVKFFPEPSGSFVRDYSSLKAFWWMRHSQGPLNIKSVLERWGGQLDSLHIHLVPDNPNTNVGKLKNDIFSEVASFQNSSEDKIQDLKVTLSSWFDTEQEMLSVLDRCNVYIAPRPSEGIGMGFLKAMSRGMIVLAHDMPTHNEYIAHSVNGFLFKNSDTEEQDLSKDLKTVGKLAKITCDRGRRDWDAQIPELISFVKSLAEPKSSKGYLTNDQYKKIVNAYFKGPNLYKSTIEKELPLLSVSARSAVQGPKVAITSVKSLIPVFKIDTIYGLGGRGAESFFYGGWSEPESGKNWILGTDASLCFSCFEKEMNKDYFLTFKSRTTSKNIKQDKKPLIIYLNQVEIFSKELTEKYKAYTVKVPFSLLCQEKPNILHFECQSTMKHKSYPERISCAFDSFVMTKKDKEDPVMDLGESYLKGKLLKKKSSLVDKIKRLV